MRLRHGASGLAYAMAILIGLLPDVASDFAGPVVGEGLDGAVGDGEHLDEVPLETDPYLGAAVVRGSTGAPFTTSEPTPETRTEAESPSAGAAEATVLSASGDTSGPTVAGVTWTAGTAPAGISVEIRARAGGVWSEWLPAEVDAVGAADVSAPDGVRDGTVPFLAGRVDEVQAAVRAAGAVPSDMQLAIVSGGDPATHDEPATKPAAALAPTSGVSLASYEAQVTPVDGVGALTLVGLAAPRPAMHSRAQWGADESIMTWTPQVGEVRGAVIHHTAGTNDYAQSDVPALVRGIYQYHAISRGWGDIGYNFLVDKYGQIWEGRAGGADRAIIGGHAIGVNAQTTGVSLMGNFDTVEAPSVMIAAAERVIAWKFSLHGVRAQAQAPIGDAWRWPVIGHRDVAQTTCPGRYVYGRLNEIRMAVISMTASGSIPIQQPMVVGWYPQRFKLGLATSTPHGGLISGGSVQQFSGGQVHYSPSTGAHAVLGGIGNLWASLGRERGALGYPVTDEGVGLPQGGAWQQFQRGYIHWSPASGAHSTRGAIGALWRSQSSERGGLGYPTSEEVGGLRGGGVYQRFQGGFINWTAATGAHSTRGAIGTLWRALGSERGGLGYPTSEEVGGLNRGGVYQRFEGGYVNWTAATGAHSTRGAIGRYWRAQGSENGSLGYPTSEEVPRNGGVYQEFEGGTLDYDNATRSVTMTR